MRRHGCGELQSGALALLPTVAGKPGGAGSRHDGLAKPIRQWFPPRRSWLDDACRPRPLTFQEVATGEGGGALDRATLGRTTPWRRSAERGDDLPVRGLRERLHGRGPHVAQHAEAQREAGGDGVVRRLVDEHQVVGAHRHVDRLEAPAHLGQLRLGLVEPARRLPDRLHATVGVGDERDLTTDPDGRVTGWNKGAENLLGWAEAEALGMDARLTFTPEDRARGEPEAEMAAAEGRAGNERWHLRKDGSRFWGSGVLVPLRGDHERGFLKVMRDRTARREGDEQQRLLLQELAHRVKNSLAVVLAAARRGGERAADLAGFLEDFEGRLLALAAVHDLLSDNGWLGVRLPGLVRLALAPHDGEGRI